MNAITLVGILAWLLVAPAFAQDVAPPRPPLLCQPIAESLRGMRYPREAIAAVLERGEAVVAFTIDGDRIVDVRIVSASDPVFGDAGLAIVRSFACHSDRPLQMEIPMVWKRE